MGSKFAFAAIQHDFAAIQHDFTKIFLQALISWKAAKL